MLPLRLGCSLALLAMAALVTAAGGPAGAAAPRHSHGTATPIQHLVVVFQENISFDHYFGTYPNAANPGGEPRFVAAPGTPSVNGLTPGLLQHNPNGVNPFRLDRSQPLTCDQDHDYLPEQLAFDHGLMDQFPENTQVESCSAPDVHPPNLVMGYYDGNTVTAMWNYAQHFAMSDNSYGTTFGPSTPGALNLISGQTHGGVLTAPDDTVMNSNNTVYGDEDPTYDDCSSTSFPTLSMQASNQNIGDLLNAAGVTWGWFQGGFKPTVPYDPGSGTKAVCGSSHVNVGGATVADYSAHHEPFQYYASTANPHHLPPKNVAEIGHNGRANHQYDLSDFYTALHHGDMPAVSFIKAAKYQDGHAGYSDPLDEQHFLVTLINQIERSADWSSTAIVIAYDDSDGWYDHQMGPIMSNSQDATEDGLTDPGLCGTGQGLGGYQDRCGYGPRLPLMVISPYSKVNFVDSSVTDQSSVLAFVEDNWLGGERIGDGSFDSVAGSLGNMFDFSGFNAQPLFLSPRTGEPR
jgi:phospholipase C